MLFIFQPSIHLGTEHASETSAECHATSTPIFATMNAQIRYDHTYTFYNHDLTIRVDAHNVPNYVYLSHYGYQKYISDAIEAIQAIVSGSDTNMRDSLINTIRYQWLHDVKGGVSPTTGIHTCLSNNDKIVFNFLKTTLDGTTLKFALTVNICLDGVANAHTTSVPYVQEYQCTSSECSYSESRECTSGKDQTGVNAITVDVDVARTTSTRITLTTEDNDSSVTQYQITHTPFNGTLFKDERLQYPIQSCDVLYVSNKNRSVSRSKLKRAFVETSHTNSIDVFYKPNLDFFGSDTFMFRVKDTSRWSTCDALVEIKMHKNVDPPTCIAQIGDARVDAKKNELTRIDMSAQDNGGSIALYEIVCVPVRGTLFRTQDTAEEPLREGDQVVPINGHTYATVYYKAQDDVHGASADMFTFKAKDILGQWSVSNGNIEIHILNVRPIAKSQFGDSAVIVDKHVRSEHIVLECDTENGSVPKCFIIERLPLNGSLFNASGTTPIDPNVPINVENSTLLATTSRSRTGRVKNNIMIEHGIRTSKPRSTQTSTPNSITLLYKTNDAFYGSDSFTFNAVDQNDQHTLKPGTVELKVDRIILPTPISQTGEHTVHVVGTTPTQITLAGNDLTGTTSKFKISCFPTSGNLYTTFDNDTVSGQIGPTTVITSTTSSTSIYYKAHNTQGGLTDTFTFIVGYGTLWSVETGIVDLQLESDNKHPTAVSLIGDSAVIVPQDRSVPLVFDIHGTDTDGSITTFQITNLPFNGKLYNNPLMLDEHCVSTDQEIDASPQQQQRRLHPRKIQTTNSIRTLSKSTTKHRKLKHRRTLDLPRSMSDSTQPIGTSSTSTSHLGHENSITLYYKSNTDFTGSDIFTFRVRDTFGEWSVKDGIVEIKVPQLQDMPRPLSLTGDMAIQAQSGLEVTITLEGLDGDGVVSAFEIASVPVHGTLFDSDQTQQLKPGSKLNAVADANSTPGKKIATITYVSEENFYGCDVLTFKVVDSIHTWKSHPAHIEIKVTNDNAYPVPISQVIYATHHSMSRVVLTEKNTIDQFQIVLRPFNGTLHAVVDEHLCVIDEINTITCEFEYDLYYKPNEGFIGSDVFTFKLRDSVSGLWSLQTGIIELKVVTAPVAENLEFTIENVNDVTELDMIDRNVSHFKITQLPEYGTLYLDANTQDLVVLNTPISDQSKLYYTYTDPLNPQSDCFTYQVFDLVWSDPTDTTHGIVTLNYGANAQPKHISIDTEDSCAEIELSTLDTPQLFFRIEGELPDSTLGTLYTEPNLTTAVEPDTMYRGKTVYFKRST